MRARAKATKQFFCGEARSYSGGMAYLRSIWADNAQEALFLYVADREDALNDGDEVAVVEAGPSASFILMDDEATKEETADTVETEAAND